MKRIITALFLLIIMAMALSSCDPYDIVSGVGMSERMQAASLKASSDRYYANEGEVESMHNISYSGKVEGVEIDYAGKITQLVKYLDDGDTQGYYSSVKNEYSIKSASGTVTEETYTEISYLGGYMYSHADGDGSRQYTAFRDAMTWDEFSAMMDKIFLQSPNFDSENITENVSILDEEGRSTLTVTYDGYAAKDDGELIDWITYYVGCSGMSCEIEELSFEVIYDRKTKSALEQTLHIKCALSDGDSTAISCELDINDEYADIGDIKFVSRNPSQWTEIDGLDELYYLKDAISDIGSQSKGKYDIQTVVSLIDNEEIVGCASQTVEYERDGGLTFKTVTEAEEENMTSVTDITYLDGTLTTKTKINGVEVAEVQKEITASTAEATLDSLLTQTIALNIGNLSDVSCERDDSGRTVITVRIGKDDRYVARYTMTEDKRFESCEITAITYIPVNGIERWTVTSYVLTDVTDADAK